MRTSVQIWLNNVSLNDIDPRIVIQKVTESKPDQKYTAVSMLRRIGQLVTGYERTKQEIGIEFAIAEKRDLMARAAILQRVNDWAASGGELTVSYRNGQRLMVYCADLIEVGYIREWTTAYKLKLVAYGVPYWEDRNSVTVSGTGTVNLAVPGTAATPLDIDVTATGTISNMSVACDGQLLAFSFGSALTSGKRLEIRHDGSIMTGWIYDGDNAPVNALMYRTAASNDEIMLTPGRHELTVTGCTASLIVRGRWV